MSDQPTPEGRERRLTRRRPGDLRLAQAEALHAVNSVSRLVSADLSNANLLLRESLEAARERIDADHLSRRLDALQTVIASAMQAMARMEPFLAELREVRTLDQTLDTRLETIAEAFTSELNRLVGEFALRLEDDVVPLQVGREAAQQAAASLQWSSAVGDRVDTTEAARMLGVTRQALGKRRTNGTLLGLPGHGTAWYPLWQFDRVGRRVRPVVGDIIHEFRQRLGEDTEPLLIASWATTSQDDLDGESPAGWLNRGGDAEQLQIAAHRAASHLAQ